MSEGQNIVDAILKTKLGDLPPDFYVAFTVGTYRVRVRTTNDGRLSASVKLMRNGDETDIGIDIRDLDPGLTLSDVFKYAKAVIDTLVKKC